MRVLKEFMKEAKSLNDNPETSSKYTIAFRGIVDYLKLADFIDQPLYLVFASPYIKDESINYIKINADKWRAYNIIVGHLVPAGANFNVSWSDNNFTTESIVNTSGVVISRAGGRHKKTNPSI